MAATKQRVREANSRHTVRLSRFLTLDAARTWLAGPAATDVERMGAFRVLADMWNEYDTAAKRLRQLKAPPGKASATTTTASGPADANTAAAARAQEIAELEERMRELRPWTYRRKTLARYMGKLAHVIAPTKKNANIDAAVDATVAELHRHGYDLRAYAAKLVPPNEWQAAVARAADAKAKAAAAVAAEAAATTPPPPTPKQEWAGTVELLVREALEEEAQTGTSWLSKFHGTEAVSTFLRHP